MDLEIEKKREKINIYNAIKVIFVLVIIVGLVVYSLYGNVKQLSSGNVEIIEVYGKSYINRRGELGFIIQDLVKINIENEYISKLNEEYFKLVNDNLNNMTFATKEDELKYGEDIIVENQILKGSILSADYTNHDHMCSILTQKLYIDGLNDNNTNVSYNVKNLDLKRNIILNNKQFVFFLKLDINTLYNNLKEIYTKLKINNIDAFNNFNNLNIFLDDDNILYLYFDNYPKQELYDLNDIPKTTIQNNINN